MIENLKKQKSSMDIIYDQEYLSMIERLNMFTPKISPEFLTPKPPIPRKAKIEVTDRCNLKCFYCQTSFKETKKSIIDRELIFKLIEELKNLGVEELGLFWLGEPLLNKELPEYISFAKQIGIKYVFITTNGVLATEERIEKIFQSGLDSIKFSINASTKVKYEKMCGKDAFDQVIANIKTTWQIRSEAKKPSIYASSIYNPSDENDFFKIHSIIKPYIDEHYPIQLYGHNNMIENNGEYKIVKASSKDMRSLQSMLPCWSVFMLPHINYDGRIGACYCDNNEKFYMGDLSKESFIEVWHSEKFVNLRRKHILKNVSGSVCENCIAFAGEECINL
jgi:radical SAM protein with 4Fe4S-binding SPASM domain